MPARIVANDFRGRARVRPLFCLQGAPPMAFVPQAAAAVNTNLQKQGCPAPSGTRLRSASALRKAGRTAQGRFVMDPTHGCCRENS